MADPATIGLAAASLASDLLPEFIGDFASPRERLAKLRKRLTMASPAANHDLHKALDEAFWISLLHVVAREGELVGAPPVWTDVMGVSPVATNAWLSVRRILPSGRPVESILATASAELARKLYPLLIQKLKEPSGSGPASLDQVYSNVEVLLSREQSHKLLDIARSLGSHAATSLSDLAWPLTVPESMDSYLREHFLALFRGAFAETVKSNSDVAAILSATLVSEIRVDVQDTRERVKWIADRLSVLEPMSANGPSLHPVINIVAPIPRRGSFVIRPEQDIITRWWEGGGRGMLVVTGNFGTGKTLLLAHCLEAMTLETPQLRFSFEHEPRANVLLNGLAGWLCGRAIDPQEMTLDFLSYLLRTVKQHILIAVDGMDGTASSSARLTDEDQEPIQDLISDSILADLLALAVQGAFPLVSWIVSRRDMPSELADAAINFSGEHAPFPSQDEASSSIVATFLTEIRLEQLPADSCLTHLRDNWRLNGSEHELREFARRCGYHPLTIEVAAGHASMHKNRSLADVSQLLPSLSEVEAIEKSRATSTGARYQRLVSKILHRVFNGYMQRLKKQSRTAVLLLQRIALFRLPVSVSDFAQAFWGPDHNDDESIDIAEIEKALEELRELSLIDPRLDALVLHGHIRNLVQRELDPKRRREMHRHLKTYFEAKAELELPTAYPNGMPDETSFIGDSRSFQLNMDLFEELIYQSINSGEWDDAFASYSMVHKWLRERADYARAGRVAQMFFPGLTPATSAVPQQLRQDQIVGLLLNWSASLTSIGMMEEGELGLLRALDLSDENAPVRALVYAELRAVCEWQGRLRRALEWNEAGRKVAEATGGFLASGLRSRRRRLQIMLGEASKVVAELDMTDPSDRLLGLFAEDFGRLQMFDSLREAHQCFKLEKHSFDRLYGIPMVLQLSNEGRHLEAIAEGNRLVKGAAAVPADQHGRKLALANAYLQAGRLGVGGATTDFLGEAADLVERVCWETQELGFAVYHLDALTLYSELLLCRGEWRKARLYAWAALHGGRIRGVELFPSIELGTAPNLFEIHSSARARSMVSILHPKCQYQWAAMSCYEVLGRSWFSEASSLPGAKEEALVESAAKYIALALDLMPLTLARRREELSVLLNWRAS